MATNTPTSTGKESSASERSRWRRIRGLKTAGSDVLSYDGLAPNKWTLIECSKAKASENLCRLFGATSWCVKDAKEAERYLPLYFYLRDLNGHLSLMGCYSDNDQILSDRANADMHGTDKILYKRLSRLTLKFRPKLLVLSSMLLAGLRDVADVTPKDADLKTTRAIISAIKRTVKTITKHS